MSKEYGPPDNLNPPEGEMDNGWEPVGQIPGWSDGEPFLTWGLEGDRVCQCMYRNAPIGHVGARVWFGPGSRGGPGQVHGGAIAAILDQMLGFAAWDNGLPSVTARITTEFRGRVVLGTLAWVDAWVDRVEDRKVITRGTLVDESGGVLAEAEGLFITVPREYFRGAADGIFPAIPEKK